MAVFIEPMMGSAELNTITTHKVGDVCIGAKFNSICVQEECLHTWLFAFGNHSTLFAYPLLFHSKSRSARTKNATKGSKKFWIENFNSMALRRALSPQSLASIFVRALSVLNPSPCFLYPSLAKKEKFLNDNKILQFWEKIASKLFSIFILFYFVVNENLEFHNFCFGIFFLNSCYFC